MSLTTSDSISPQELKIIQWLKDNELTNNFSDFVERTDAYTRLISGVMGWQWEDEFKTLCDLHGLKCESPGLNSRYDLLVNSYKVQCKFSVSRNSIDIRNKDKTFNRRYRPDDFDFMAINNHKRIFIVPMSSLLDETLTQTRQTVRIQDLQPFLDGYGALNRE